MNIQETLLPKEGKDALVAFEEETSPASDRHRSSETQAVSPANQEPKDNPLKGTLYFLLHGVIFTANFFVVKMTFERNPNMSVWQMTLARSVVSALIMVIYLNIKLKRALVNVEPTLVWALVFRTIQGSVTVMIQFTCLKYLPVFTVGIVNRLQPVVVVLIAFFVLGERLKPFDIMTLLLATSAAIMIVAGMEGESSDVIKSNPWALVGLALNPILLAAGQVAMRKMRKMPESTVTTYSAFTLILASCIMIVATGDSFTFYKDFDKTSWLLILLIGFLVVLQQTTKFTALKNQEASQLQVYSFLPSVYQVTVEALVFGFVFSSMQKWALGLLGLLYTVSTIRFIYKVQQGEKLSAAEPTPRNADGPEANDDDGFKRQP